MATLVNLSVRFVGSKSSQCPYCGDKVDRQPETHITGGRCPKSSTPQEIAAAKA